MSAASERAPPAGIALVLLAAGHSRRFGARNKLLADIAGEPLVRRVATALKAGAPRAPLIVVVGYEAQRVRAVIADVADRIVDNPLAEEGIASSIRAGIAAVPGDAAGALVAQGDMPELTADLVARLVAAFQATNGQAIVHPVRPDGRQGNPVIWPRDLFGELAQLQGDTGAKAVITAYAGRRAGVRLDDDRSQIDLDTPEAYSDWTASRGD